MTHGEYVRDITKAQFLTATSCLRRAWLDVHDPVSHPPSIGDRFRIDEGQNFHALARERYPGAPVVTTADPDAGVRLTADYLADPKVEAVCEATFRAAGLVARADAVVRENGNGSGASDGEWCVVEVKSGSNPLRADYLADVAYTTMVARRAGLPVTRAAVVTVNPSFRLGMPPRALFDETDVTELVEPLARLLVREWDDIRQGFSASEAPDGVWSMHCKGCPYFDTQCVGRGVSWPVLELPGIRQRELDLLVEAGAVGIRAIPDHLFDQKIDAARALAEKTWDAGGDGLGTAGDEEAAESARRARVAATWWERWRRIRDCVRSGRPWASGDLMAALARADWPVYFFDFETVSTPVPMWPGVRPWQQVPVQYSLHVVESEEALRRWCALVSDSESAAGGVDEPTSDVAAERRKGVEISTGVRHLEYLPQTLNGDPRRALAEHLLADLGKRGSIIVYYARFERTCIEELADALPDLRARLLALVPRIVDLWEIVREHVYHPEFHGSYSIKRVLPALVPSMKDAYASKTIGEGLSASAVLTWMARGRYEKGPLEALRQELLEYCELDTEAMVRLWGELDGEDGR